ncbi:MAG: SDR family oxidoreductase [Pseudomonadales bacterium]|nr:SDR family oxidoreductase [Pseudomonadales bacterium]
MKERFEDKRVIVTGAGSGIGRATAIRMAGEGARVWCADINEVALNETVSLIEAGGGTAAFSVFDVTDPAQSVALVNEVVEAWGGLNVLCNIAGIGGMKPFQDLTPEYFNKMLAVNLSGPFYLCHAAMPQLLKTKGNIVNLASSAGKIGQAYVAAYVASKHGLVGLTKSLAMEFGRRGVRANAICPGAVNTPLIQNFEMAEGIDFDLVNRYNFLPWFSEPEDIAAMVAYVASDEARYVNGAVLSIDGGITTG